jgi:hypothetical protein
MRLLKICFFYNKSMFVDILSSRVILKCENKTRIFKKKKQKI